MNTIKILVKILTSVFILLNITACGLIVPKEKNNIQSNNTNYSTVVTDSELSTTDAVITTDHIVTASEETTEPAKEYYEPEFDSSRFSRVEELLCNPPVHGANVAFCYEDLTTGFTYSYNGDVKMWGASVMKLPFALSILYKAENEDMGLDDVFVYTGAEYVDGTGIIKNKPFGSSFTVIELIDLSLRHSDNIAQSHLRKKYGTDVYYEYVRSIGADTFTEEWGWAMTAKHGAVMLRSAWEYLEGEYTYSHLVKEAMLNTEHQVMLSPGLSNKDFARKYGWDVDGYNDVGIVYDEHPYTLVFLSDMISGSWDVNGYISEIARIIDGLHEEIWGTAEEISAYTVINTVQEDLLWDAEQEN